MLLKELHLTCSACPAEVDFGNTNGAIGCTAEVRFGSADICSFSTFHI
jgi:hypothetical protein